MFPSRAARPACLPGGQSEYLKGRRLLGFGEESLWDSSDISARLAQILAADLAKPLQMCDALSRNEPKDFQPLLPAVDAGTDLTLTAATHTTQAFVLLSNSAGRIISIPNGLSKSKRSLRNTRRSTTNFKHFRAEPFQPMPDRITLQSYTARIIAAPCGVISGSPRCGQWFCRQVHPHDRRQKVVRSPALPWLPPALRRHCFAGVNRQTRIA